tara:strand:+ start:35949 stop:36662 length:714 start_codon:yes stop_codon:yes gene_type:complete
MLINNNLDIILKKYLLLVKNYSIFFLNSIKKTDDNLYISLYIKGINIIDNVFNISLNTLNTLNDVYNNTEKAYVYFIEFLNQINLNFINNKEENNFDFTIKDAIIFAYKKTILQNEIKIMEQKNRINNDKYFDYIKNIKIVNNFYILYLDYYIKKKIFSENNYLEKFKNIFSNLEKRINFLYNNNISLEKLHNFIKTINNLTSYHEFDKKNENLDKFFDNNLNLFLNNTNNYDYNII